MLMNRIYTEIVYLNTLLIQDQTGIVIKQTVPG